MQPGVAEAVLLLLAEDLQLQEELLAAGGLGKQSRGLEVGEGRSVQRRNGDDDAYAQVA